MLKTKSLYFIIISIPLLILLVLGFYFSDKSWQAYQENKTVQRTLNDAVLLEKYEISVLNEILCTKLVAQQDSEVANICKERIETTKALAQTLEQADDNVKHWAHKIALLREDSSKKKIENFETFLGKKEIHSSVHQFLESIKNETRSNDVKKLLSTYTQLSDKRYATELENFLVTYYVSKHIPVSTLNVIYWDKIVEASSLSDINVENLGDVSQTLENVLTSESLYKILSKIDDMRITILTGSMDPKGKYLDWISLLEEKSHILETMKNSVKTSIDTVTVKEKEEVLKTLLFYVLMSILSFLALVMLYLQAKREKRENESLVDVLNKIATLTPYTSSESEVMHQMLNKMQNKEDAFSYIFHSFQLLNQKVKQANDVAMLKSDFLATLSHEIRTPLNGIIGFSKLLRDMGTTLDQEEFLSLIEGSSRNLIAIVNDILELSKIDADKMDIESVSFDIFNTVESTVSTFTYQTDQKDIELALFIDPFLSHYFLGDATKISQILTNLIGNAVKFTNPYGKINIFVQNLHDDENKVKIKFAVHDNGIGLSEEQVENIFNPYSQATKSTSKNFGGTGLGLTISQKMVELMGGKLEVESSVDKGATFFFTLILQKDKEKVFTSYPHFEGVSVGLALPAKSIKRQLDTNLEIYLRHLGAKFKIYYYEELFGDDVWVDLPDIMIFDHHYARLSGELEQCASIDCKSVLLTNSTLHSRVNPEVHHFTDVIYTPVTLHKAIRILTDIKREIPMPQKKIKNLENVDSFRGLNALVADDNMINRKLIKIILEKVGVQVTLSENGQEAFDTYKKDSYDIIFMDIQMPVLDGVESTKKILAYERENGLAHTPIIALTANVGVGDKERYISEGMDDYATKPLDIETLKRMISKHYSVTVSSEDKEK